MISQHMCNFDTVVTSTSLHYSHNNTPELGLATDKCGCVLDLNHVRQNLRELYTVLLYSYASGPAECCLYVDIGVHGRMRNHYSS